MGISVTGQRQPTPVFGCKQQRQHSRVTFYNHKQIISGGVLLSVEEVKAGRGQERRFANDVRPQCLLGKRVVGK